MAESRLKELEGRGRLESRGDLRIMTPVISNVEPGPRQVSYSHFCTRSIRGDVGPYIGTTATNMQQPLPTERVLSWLEEGHAPAEPDIGEAEPANSIKSGPCWQGSL